jgi:dipeptidyl aminopeptidase/acylaminoacyl peptidase
VHGLDGQFREVMEVENDREFAPIRLSYDGERLYGFSEKDRPQRDLVEFDPAQGKIVRTIFSRPGVDLAGALFDDRRNPIGVRYYESGRLVSHYFDEENAKLGALLQKAFPGRTVATLYRSRDARKFLLWVDDSDVPPQIFHLDLDRRKAELLDEFYPHLAGRTMAPTHALKVKVADGTVIDAFLTLPRGEGKRPLVVMPHGGPVGIADVLHFNHDAQFVASLGYAVLRVNFRGSAGYGRKFEEAGRRQHGKGIEDDIDAAINAALSSHPLDPGRMCLVGTSYGGYSALISTLRWPGRFRCAVSIAGVTDRVLRFTASDGARSEEGRKLMIEAMGDPRQDLDAMIEASPLYQYRKLTTPLMLVHGRDDFRVDFEHTRRLVRMLNLDGRPPVVLAIAGEGHGFAKLKSMAIVWTGIAGFLRQHLDAVPPTTVPATTPAATGAPPAAGE